MSYDLRFLRFQQGVVALVLLAGFVFGADWVIPLLAVVLGVGAAGGRSANLLYFVFDVVVATRLGPQSETVGATAVRVATLLAVGILALATALVALGVAGLAWVLALALAVSEAVGAVAGIALGRGLYDRLRRRGS